MLVSTRYLKQNCGWGIIVLIDIKMLAVIAYSEKHFKKLTPAELPVYEI